MENCIALGLLMVVLGAILRLTYHNNRNYFFGYRTTRSCKNNDNWNLANKASSVHLMIIGLLSVAVGVFDFGFLPEKFHIKIEAFVIGVGIGVSIFIIEKKLKQNDEKNNT